MMVHSAHKTQFVHPYFFAVILATLTVMSLVENSVLDYDNIMLELWKSHMISLLYFGTLWFSSKSSAFNTEKHRGLFLHRAQQDGLLLSAAIALFSSVGTSLAPYTSVAYTNFLWFMPFVFVLIAFFGILWLTEFERFKERFTAAGETRAAGQHEMGKGTPITSLVMSSVLLILTGFVVIYYWRDFSIVWHATQENMPMRSVQYNTSYLWLNPVF